MPLKTTSNTKSQHQNGINVQGTHKLFQDAFEIARRLEIRYVWVDSLCIVQDDKEDWTHQAGMMAEIYSHSYLNLAATALRNSTESLFGERHTPGDISIRDGGIPPRILRTDSFSPPSTPDLSSDCEDPLATPVVRIRESHRRDHQHVRSDHPHGRHKVAPMLERGWIFQERLLSRRTLHFCASEIIWECRSSYDCECGGMDLETDKTPHLEAASFTRQALYRIDDEQFHKIPRKHKFSHAIYAPLKQRRIDVHDLWLELVDAYSGLAISKHKDRFYALGGIAKKIGQQLPGEQYLAGLWSGDLIRGLLWDGIPHSQPDIQRDTFVPTWSWMSRNWFRDKEGGSKSIAHYTRFKQAGFTADERVVVHMMSGGGPYETEGGVHFAPVKEGSGILELSAPFLAASLRIAGQHDDSYWQMREPQVSEPSREIQLLETAAFSFGADCPGPKGDALQDGDDVACVLMGRASSGSQRFARKEHVLVLRADKKRGVNIFQRIGVLEISYDSLEAASLFCNAMVRRFKLA